MFTIEVYKQICSEGNQEKSNNILLQLNNKEFVYSGNYSEYAQIYHNAFNLD